MHLDSVCKQRIQLLTARLTVYFGKKKIVHPESSYKFTEETLGALLSDSGFTTHNVGKDQCGWYALTLSSRLEG